MSLVDPHEIPRTLAIRIVSAFDVTALELVYTQLTKLRPGQVGDDFPESTSGTCLLDL